MFDSETDDEVDPNVTDDEVLDDVLDDEDDSTLDTEDAEEGDDDEDGEEGSNASSGSNPPQEDDKKPLSRRAARVQKLEKERDEKVAEAAEYKAKLDSLLAAQKNQPVDDSARRAEEARVAAMDPVEREHYNQQRKIAALEQQVSNLGFAQADGLDRAKFEAKAELNPVYKKYAAAVEKTLEEMRAKGVNTTREALLTYKLGEAARKKLEAGAGESRRRKDAAQARVGKVNGKPANMRGDSSGTGKAKTLEDRLRGVQI